MIIWTFCVLGGISGTLTVQTVQGNLCRWTVCGSPVIKFLLDNLKLLVWGCLGGWLVLYIRSDSSCLGTKYPTRGKMMNCSCHTQGWCSIHHATHHSYSKLIQQWHIGHCYFAWLLPCSFVAKILWRKVLVSPPLPPLFMGKYVTWPSLFLSLSFL